MSCVRNAGSQRIAQLDSLHLALQGQLHARAACSFHARTDTGQTPYIMPDSPMSSAPASPGSSMRSGWAPELSGSSVYTPSLVGFSGTFLVSDSSSSALSFLMSSGLRSASARSSSFVEAFATLGKMRATLVHVPSRNLSPRSVSQR